MRCTRAAHEKALEAAQNAFWKEEGLDTFENTLARTIDAYLTSLLADKALVEEMAEAIGKATCVRDDYCCRNDQAQAALDVIRRKVT